MYLLIFTPQCIPCTVAVLQIWSLEDRRQKMKVLRIRVKRSKDLETAISVRNTQILGVLEYIREMVFTLRGYIVYVPDFRLDKCRFFGLYNCVAEERLRGQCRSLSKTCHHMKAILYALGEMLSLIRSEILPLIQK